ncbi:Cyclin-D5-1 [Hordeum vulgare]|nr:Cyclin-D5-1 [Hordeum vulgare]
MCQEDGGKLLLMYSADDDNDGEEDEEGYMDHLVSKESSFCSADPSPSMASRRDTVRWILERSVMPWAARLLAIACVSLAAKMDECQASALSEFRADDDYD